METKEPKYLTEKSFVGFMGIFTITTGFISQIAPMYLPVEMLVFSIFFLYNFFLG